MLFLEAKVRKETGAEVKTLRKKGFLPGVLYGPATESTSLEVNLKEFEKTYREAGESSLVSLGLGNKKFLVLIYDVQFDPVNLKPIHADFYQPSLKKEVEVGVPIVFEGAAPAVKNLGGTLIKNLKELKIKALPEYLPHEIKIDVSKLQTFEDVILVKDIPIPKEVKILENKDEIIAQVVEPEKVEEELAKPPEEKIEEVEKVGKVGKAGKAGKETKREEEEGEIKEGQ